VMHPVLGPMRLVRNPLVAGSPADTVAAAPPTLGQHDAPVPTPTFTTTKTTTTS
jgi:hypothetical protein